MATDTLIERLLRVADEIDTCGVTTAVGQCAVTHLLRDAAAALAARDQQIAQLWEALTIIHTASRDDAKSECWAIRKWLDERGVYNEDIGSVRRLVEAAAALALSALPARQTESAPPAYGRQPCGCFVDSSGVTSILCAQHRPRWRSPIPGKGEGDSLQARAEALWIQIRPPRDRRSAQWFAFDDRAVAQIVDALRQERR